MSVLEVGGGELVVLQLFRMYQNEWMPSSVSGKGGTVSGRGQETLTGPTSCRSLDGCSDNNIGFHVKPPFRFF